MNLKLRDWQKKALAKAINWLLVERSELPFLVNAAPGAGKTIGACVIAQTLLNEDEIDRVVNVM